MSKCSSPDKPDAQKKWVDLSEYGLELMLLRTTNNNYLAIVAAGSMEQYSESAEALGFRRIQRNERAMFRYIMVDGDGVPMPVRAPDLEKFRREFPSAVAVDLDSAKHYKKLAEIIPADKVTEQPAP